MKSVIKQIRLDVLAQIAKSIFCFTSVVKLPDRRIEFRFKNDPDAVRNIVFESLKYEFG